MHRFAELGTIGSPRTGMGMRWSHSFVGKGLLSTHRNQRKVPYVPQELAQIPWCHLVDVLMYGYDSVYKNREEEQFKQRGLSFL
jgi:hypothetical protein